MNKKKQFLSGQESNLALQFPIMLKVMTDEETREYHIKKLYQLSLKLIGQIPQLEQSNYEQKQWIENKMKAPDWAWRSLT